MLPGVTDVYEKERMLDEMPQSGTGRTVTTTEPKFVPADAAELSLPGNMQVKVRLVDCVGYMIPGRCRPVRRTEKPGWCLRRGTKRRYPSSAQPR